MRAAFPPHAPPRRPAAPPGAARARVIPSPTRALPRPKSLSTVAPPPPRQHLHPTRRRPPPASQLACKRSAVGPDPYGVTNTNLWNQWIPRPGSQRCSSRFRPDDRTPRSPFSNSRATPWCSRSMAFDPYYVSSRNAWRHDSQSIRSILAPPMPQTPRGSPFLPQRPSSRAPGSPSSHLNSSRASLHSQGSPRGYSPMRATPAARAFAASTGLSRRAGSPFY